MSQVKGPLGRKVHRDSDSFADDKIGAQKQKRNKRRRHRRNLGPRPARLSSRAERSACKRLPRLLKTYRKFQPRTAMNPERGWRRLRKAEQVSRF